MVWTVVLQTQSATSTFDLNDSTLTFLNVGGFNAPPPERRFSFAGGNLSRHGGDLIQRVYDNRQVRVGFQLKATNASLLGSAVQDVWALLRRAEEYSKSGLGTQVQLKYQWESGGTTVYFNVLEGVLDLGRDFHSAYMLKGTRLRNADLSLLCEPFAVGTAETAENYLNDPSFEVAGTALADWTADDGTGTGVRTTAQSKYGTAALELRRTGGTADNRRYQETTAFTGSDNISASVWVRPQAMTSGMSAMMRLTYLNTGGTVLGSSTVSTSVAGTAFIQVTVGSVVGSTNLGTIRYEMLLTGGTGTGTVQFDGAGLWKAAAVPKAWVSSRNVRNHLDDAAQAHTNYLDVYDVPGDVPAALQLKASENEAHTDFWVGARHAGRLGDGSVFLEAESFTGFGTVIAIGDASNGSVGRDRLGFTRVATGSALFAGTGTATLSLDAGTGSGRMVVVGLAIATNTGTTVSFGGTAMTLGTRVAGTDAPLTRAEVWYLTNPPTGTSTVVAVFSASSTGVLGGVTFANVGQNRILFGTAGTGNSATSSGSFTASSTLANIGVMVLANNANAAPAGVALPGGSTIVSTGYGTGFLFMTDGTATGSPLTGSWAGGVAGTLVGVLASFYPFIGTDSSPIVRTTAIGTPPQGQYRVLSRLNNAAGRDLFVGVGYSYGAVTLTPTATANFLSLGTATGFKIADLGALTVPPIDTPASSTIGTYTLRFAHFLGTPGGSMDLDVDWVMLMPVDQGFAYANKASAQQRMLADSRSSPKAVYILNTSDVVQSVPANQVGDPPEVHPQGSRFYFVSDGNTASVADGWTMNVTYVPRWLQVG